METEEQGVKQKGPSPHQEVEANSGCLNKQTCNY